MIGTKRVLAVCPARGGSKGIPLKNLQPFRGVPLVATVGQLVAKIPEIDRAVVSTDHDEIARVAEDSGLAAPFRRPETLSGDRIGDLEGDHVARYGIGIEHIGRPAKLGDVLVTRGDDGGMR